MDLDVLSLRVFLVRLDWKNKVLSPTFSG